MPTVNALPGELNLELFPRNDYTITATFPDEIDLTGREFEYRIEGADPIACTVTGQDLSWPVASITSDHRTCGASLVETTGVDDNTLFGGRVRWSVAYDSSLDTLAVSVLATGDISVDLTVLGGFVSSGGGGAVDSVNGQVGVVVLTAADVGADPTGTAAGLVAAEATTRSNADTAEATARASAVSAEATARAAADTTLQTNITNEATARASAVTAEATARSSADTTEATARAAADLLLIPLTQKAAANGVATLDSNSLVPAAQLPSITISDWLGAVASQAAMLALSGQRGDWATRTDTSTTWMLIGDDATQLANWKLFLTPADAVSSVNGRTGAVTGLAEATDVTAEATARAAAVTAEATARANADALLAPLAGPVFTADPKAPTPAQGDNDTSIATTAFVQTELGFYVPKSLLTTKGDTIARSSTAPVRVAVGTDGQVYTADAASAAGVKWATPVGDKLGLTPTAVKTANYTAAAGDLVPCDTSGGAFTVTLPTAPADGTVVAVKLVTAGNTLNLALGGSDVFNKSGGATTGTLTLANQGLLLQYKATGAIWYVAADDLSLSVLDARFANQGATWPLSVKRSGQTRFWTVPGLITTSASLTTTAVLAATDYYFFFSVGRAISVTDVAIRVTTGPVGAATAQAACYATTDEGQPTAATAPKWDQQLAVGNGATGVFSASITPVTLVPGNYALALNVSAAMTLAGISVGGQIGWESLASATDPIGKVGRAHAAFPTPGTAWTTAAGLGAGVTHLIFLRYALA